MTVDRHMSDWQKAQAAKCSCRGSDDMCPCQNVDPRTLKFCAPGDRQEDVWLIRFDDNDVADKVFIGPDAEREARDMWDRMCGPSGTWNGYLFRLARYAG